MKLIVVRIQNYFIRHLSDVLHPDISVPGPTTLLVHETLPTKAVIAITVISLLCLMTTVACVVCVVLRVFGKKASASRRQGAGRRKPAVRPAAVWQGVRHPHRPQVGIPAWEVSRDVGFFR